MSCSCSMSMTISKLDLGTYFRNIRLMQRFPPGMGQINGKICLLDTGEFLVYFLQPTAVSAHIPKYQLTRCKFKRKLTYLAC